MRRLILCINATASTISLGLAALLAQSALAGDWVPFGICLSTAAITATTLAWHVSGPTPSATGCGQRI
jgi:hypothetical protein